MQVSTIDFVEYFTNYNVRGKPEDEECLLD